MNKIKIEELRDLVTSSLSEMKDRLILDYTFSGDIQVAVEYDYTVDDFCLTLIDYSMLDQYKTYLSYVTAVDVNRDWFVADNAVDLFVDAIADEIAVEYPKPEQPELTHDILLDKVRELLVWNLDSLDNYQYADSLYLDIYFGWREKSGNYEIDITDGKDMDSGLDPKVSYDPVALVPIKRSWLDVCEECVEIAVDSLVEEIENFIKESE